MRKIDINITGVGPHAAIPAITGGRIIIQTLMLTISHAKDKSQLISFFSGDDLITEFYLLDGGEVEFERREGDEERIGFGKAFNITLPADVSAAGYAMYEVGGQ